MSGNRSFTVLNDLLVIININIDTTILFLLFNFRIHLNKKIEVYLILKLEQNYYIIPVINIIKLCIIHIYCVNIIVNLITFFKVEILCSSV